MWVENNHVERPVARNGISNFFSRSNDLVSHKIGLKNP